LISELKDLVRQVFPEAIEALAQSGGNWLQGKGQQEIAKAMEIRATVMEKLGNLEIQRQKLINERNEISEKAQTERQHNEQLHKERMF